MQVTVILKNCVYCLDYLCILVRYPGYPQIHRYPWILGITPAGENLKFKIHTPPPFPTNSDT